MEKAKGKTTEVLVNTLNNISVISCFSSSDIACFNQDAFMSINVRVSREEIDKKKFVESRIPIEWIQAIGTNFFSTHKDIFVERGCQKYIKNMVARVNQGEFLDEFLGEYDAEKGTSSGKTEIYRHKLVEQYLDYLKAIATKHDVPFCFVSLIHRIVCLSTNQTDLSDYGNIINFFKEKERKGVQQSNKLTYFPFQSFTDIPKKDLERLVRIFFNQKLQKIFDNNKLNDFVNRLLDYYDFYVPGNLTDEENKKIFLDIYDEVYNLYTEIIWIIVFSNTIDFWITERLRGKVEFQELKDILSGWSPLVHECQFIRNMDDKEKLNDFIDQKYFWIKIFSFLTHDLLLDKIPENVVSQLRRMDDSESRFVPEYGEKYFADGIKKETDDLESEEYFEYTGLTGKCNLFNENYEGIKDEKIEDGYEEDEEEEYKLKEYKTLPVANRLIGQDQIAKIEKHFIYSTTFREQTEKYLFNNYQLTGTPETIIYQFIKYVKLCASEHLRTLYNKQLNAVAGVSEKTARRYLEQYKEEDPYANDVNYITDLPLSKVETFMREKESDIHHRIPGYISQNKLCKLLTKREPFDQKSSKTILRKLQKLIQDGKIDAPMVEDFGKYFKEGNVKDIVDELMIEIFGYSLTERAENQ